MSDDDALLDGVLVCFVYARASCARSQTPFATSSSHDRARMQELSDLEKAGSMLLVVVAPQPLDFE